jgi:phospholipase/carboxylesterase
MNLKQKLFRIGPFECLDIPSEEMSDWTVVIFHGYGADAFDLAPLHKQLDPEGKCRWLFPQGPERVSIGPGFYGQAWMKIPDEALAKMFRGEYRDYTMDRLFGLDEMRERGLQFLSKLKVAPEKLILGGFSQGSMVAVELAQNLPVQPAGLVILSGNIVDLPGLRANAERLKGLSFFQSHGDKDQILSIEGARKLEGGLQNSGAKGKLISFSGGHEIPGPILSKLKSYLVEITTR